jgi:hypothetical protein
VILGGEMRNLPDFIVDPSGRVHDIRHLKSPKHQLTEQDQDTQYAEYLNKIETDNESYKEAVDNLSLRSNVTFMPIGITLVGIILVGIIIVIVIIALKMQYP